MNGVSGMIIHFYCSEDTSASKCLSTSYSVSPDN